MVPHPLLGFGSTSGHGADHVLPVVRFNFTFWLNRERIDCWTPMYVMTNLFIVVHRFGSRLPTCTQVGLLHVLPRVAWLPVVSGFAPYLYIYECLSSNQCVYLCDSVDNHKIFTFMYHVFFIFITVYAASTVVNAHNGINIIPLPCAPLLA